MTDGGERVNLIFDLVVPTDEKVDKEQLVAEIQSKIKEENSKYYAVIKVEHSYV